MTVLVEVTPSPCHPLTLSPLHPLTTSPLSPDSKYRVGQTGALPAA